MLRPSAPPQEITIDLPPLLVESLGVGAEMLAKYLNELAEVGVNDPANHPPPMPILCRICERQITPWWFEKHTDLCLQEHKAESEIQLAQENLAEHRNAIVKVLDALEKRKSRPLSPEPVIPAPAEYKGLAIGSNSTPSSGPSSGSASPAAGQRSREQSISGFGHARARSFAVRRPLARIVELVLDLCDTASEINVPAIKETRTESGGGFRTQSPTSESRISQVLQWQSPSTSTLEQEQGLALLCADTERVSRAKVEAVLRHRQIIEYSERIRVEFNVLVDDCIAAALDKASRIAAGEISSSESSDEDEQPTPAADDPTKELHQSRPGSSEPQAGISAMAFAMRNASDPSVAYPSQRRASSKGAISTRSSSPIECPTPRSHKSTYAILSQKRGSVQLDADTGDSDSSLPSSSVLSATYRTDSPASDFALSRATSSRDRKRKSLILPGLSSPRRQQSPARNVPPPSPLRVNKPRIPSGDAVPSPITSPMLNQGEFHSPILTAHHPHHHRRQSSAASSEVMKPPPSPRVNPVSHPQPRAVPPSIKDFEIIKPISKGAFGSVYLSKKKSTGEYFAIKVLKKADMVAKNQVTNVKAERAIMMWQGESDFVAKLYWTFSSKDYLYLVMEYLNGGDCASLVKILGGLPEDWAKKYLAETVLGVEHLHSRGIVHRDLKPDNFLIDQKGHLKLTDFGLSRMGLIGRQKRIMKSPNESAPDLLKQGPFIRATSMASSRSASFDMQTNTSPGSTPLMTPSLAGDLGQPSYFNLNREASLSRAHSRRESGYRSDSGGSESLQAMFRSFSLNDPDERIPMRSGPIEEEGYSEEGGSPDQLALQPTTSHGSQPAQHTPPIVTGMQPPRMALFDPEDHNRRFVGTPDYLAPETINGIGQDEMSDWWSLGCILFEFLYGYPPFHADTPDEVFENILQRRIDWPTDDEVDVSYEAKDLMERLMTIDPHDRLGANTGEKYSSGAEEVRNHPWFSDINWETLLEDEASFVPNLENPEDTEYFDARGATLQTFAEEIEDQLSSPAVTPSVETLDRPHDALTRVRTQVNSIQRKLMPLHIPAHVRDTRSRRLSEPVIADDFGNFNFKNLPVLEKANKDVIQKLRAEAMIAQQKPPVNIASPPAASPGPSLEGSPLLPMPLKRTMSTTKPGNRSASPSSFNQAASSPSRGSQPSSPMLVQFATGHNHDRRKTSSSSSTLSHQSSSSLQPGSFFDVPRLAQLGKISSASSSPIKAPRIPPLSPEQSMTSRRQSSVPSSRSRSQTVGSQEGENLREAYIPGHHKRRSQILDVSPSSSDNEDPRTKALLRVQRRRQSSRRLSQITLADGPVFRPLDVLICEDHPVSKLVMERLLERLRCRTITASTGPEAMRFAMSEVQFDIILMEVKLPQMNGADVARMIRDTKNANTQTPIIAVTGYLKELPVAHNFNQLIEKPPTLAKLTDVLSKFCQWKPPPPGFSLPPSQSIPPSSLRQESSRTEDSPSSTSSYAQVPLGSYRGSSREDSVSSSFFGEMEGMNKQEDVPVIIGRRPTEDWSTDGLGISEEVITDKSPFVHQGFPHLVHTTSAPSTVNVTMRSPRKKRSVEGVRAKRESIEKRRHESVESGDDEDEELGHVQVRAKSPVGKKTGSRGGSSKLGTEMMRTNSRGSVISASEENIAAIKEHCISSPSTNIMEVDETAVLEGGVQSMEIHDKVEKKSEGHITPPVLFPRRPGDEVKDVIDMDITPRPRSAAAIAEAEDEPTPRPASQASKR